jgi:hypothetical protein
VVLIIHNEHLQPEDYLKEETNAQTIGRMAAESDKRPKFEDKSFARNLVV